MLCLLRHNPKPNTMSSCVVQTLLEPIAPEDLPHMPSRYQQQVARASSAERGEAGYSLRLEQE